MSAALATIWQPAADIADDGGLAGGGFAPSPGSIGSVGALASLSFDAATSAGIWRIPMPC